MAKNKEPILTDEEREKLLAEDALRRNRRSRYYGKLTQTSSEYEKANIVRGKSFGQIVSERMLRGEMGGSALKGAMGEKIGAVGMGIKQKFDPLNVLNKVPVIGSALSTMYGMKRGRAASDISYFTGAGRFLRQQPEPGELGHVPGQGSDTGLASKVKTSVMRSETVSGVPQKNINSTKTTLGAIKKLYALERMWYDQDRKYKEEEKKAREIAGNFAEELDAEGKPKSSKLPGAKKYVKSESKGFFSGLFDLFKNLFGAAGFLGMLQGLGTMLAGAFAPLLAVLGPIVAVVGALTLAMKGITWLISKFTGKPMDYLEKKYDKNTTPKDIQKDFDKVQGGMNGPGITDKQYENNKKTLASDKPVAGFQNGKWVKDVRPELQKQNDTYDRVQQYKGSNDPFQTYRRDVESGHVKRETSFEDWKKQQGMSGTGDKSLPRNLRNNNPGNIRFEKGGFAEKHGATGADDKGFAIFPTMEAGEQAQKDLLFKTESYKNLTTDQAISRYAPSSENNTGAYQNMIKKSLGSSYDPNKKLSEYSEQDQQKIVTAMQKMEGGTVEGYKLAQEQKASPIPQADSLSNRMNVAVSENKNLTTQPSNIPPIMVNTTNNVMGSKGGGQSVAMGPTPIRNDEPMLLRAQYGAVKPV